jgi:hypothetical protein
MSIKFVALDPDVSSRLRKGGPDANGQPAEQRTSEGGGEPCRHCLQHVAAGEPYLIAAHRPFPAPQPYAEIGPIFLHANECGRGGGDAKLPAFLASPTYIVRGYSADDRIVYGTGSVVETLRIPARARELLARADIDYLHVRSAANNCYHCRIERA